MRSEAMMREEIHWFLFYFDTLYTGTLCTNTFYWSSQDGKLRFMSARVEEKPASQTMKFPKYALSSWGGYTHS